MTKIYISKIHEGTHDDISCRSASSSDSKIKNFLRLNNYDIVENEYEADDIIINTCGVLQSFEQKYIDRIHQIKNLGTKKIVVFGCLAGVSTSMKEMVDFSIPTKQEYLIENFYSHSIKFKDVPITILSADIEKDFPTQQKTYFLQTNRGCIHNCSYCGIKKAIGGPTSKPINSVIEEVKYAQDNGYTQIYLITDDIGSYGYDIKSNFPELLHAILKQGDSFVVSIDYSEPSQWIKWLPYVKYDLTRVKRLLCPIQSANDRILKMMNRSYSVEEYKRMFESTKGYNPQLEIHNNFIYCYPTETFDEFKENLKYITYFDKTSFNPFSYINGKKKFTQDEIISIPEVRKRINLIEKLKRAYPEYIY